VYGRKKQKARLILRAEAKGKGGRERKPLPLFEGKAYKRTLHGSASGSAKRGGTQEGEAPPGRTDLHLEGKGKDRGKGRRKKEEKLPGNAAWRYSWSIPVRAGRRENGKNG